MQMVWLVKNLERKRPKNNPHNYVLFAMVMHVTCHETRVSITSTDTKVP